MTERHGSTDRGGWWARLGSDRAWSLFALLLLLGFVVVTIGPALVGHGVLLDVGTLTRYMPWRVNGIDHHVNWCRGDTVDGVIPQTAAIAQGLRNGHIPMWSPYTIGGTPLAALPNDGILNPAAWPYFVLPVWLAPAFVKLMQFVIGVAGMVAFLGRLGVRRGPAVIAGIVFVSSGFMVMWTNWPQVLVGCFIPALFWSLDRAVVERRARDIAFVGMVVACMVLGGFPAVTLYALTVGAVYVLARGLRLSRGRASGDLFRGFVCAGLGVVLGVALSAVQLLPFVKNLGALRLSERGTGGSQPVGQFLTALAPSINGTCIGGVHSGPVNPIEGIAFLGAAALVLALCAVALRLPGPRPRPRPVLLGVLCLVVVVLIWIGREPLQLLQQLPGYSSNGIGRATSMFGFLAAALAGFGLDRLITRARSSERVERSTRGLLVSTVIVAVVVAFTAWAFADAYASSQEGGQLPVFRRALVVPAVVLALAVAGVVVTLVLRGRWRLLGPLVLAVAVVAQSTLFVHTLLPRSERSDFYPVTRAHRFLQSHIGHDRYLGGSFWGYPPGSTFFKLNTPVGHGFQSTRWLDLLLAISPDIQLTRTYTAFPYTVPTAEVGNMPLLDQMAVRYFATSPGDVVGTTAPSTRRGRDAEPLRLAPRERGACQVRGGPLRGIEVRLARGRRLPHTSYPSSTCA